jgi:hypothetical protein
MRMLVVLLVLVACAPDVRTPTAPAIRAPGCATAPAVARVAFRHRRSRFTAALGAPRHRGVDLIAAADDPVQTLGGKLAYASIDKDLGGEDVVVFACLQATWSPLGIATTDRDGRFALALTGADRLPPGLRELYAVVPGDGSGARFLAYVAARGERVVVTDIDGTLTGAENAVLDTVLFGDDIAHRAGAPEALGASGMTVVYLSSRGDQLTELTRQWLAAHGFPPGPLRLAPAVVTRPGPRTVALKAALLRALGVPIAAAIGNKPTDVEAYAQAGVPATRIFVKLPEFAAELRAALVERRAIGFHRYAELPALVGSL